MKTDNHSDSGKTLLSGAKVDPLTGGLLETERREKLCKVEFLVLSSAVVVSGVGFLCCGRAAHSTSHVIFLALVISLFLFQVRFMTRIETRKFPNLLVYSLLVWSLAGTIEALGIWFGFYRYEPTFLTALKLGPVPILIPSMWLLFCWIASSVSSFLWGPSFPRKIRYSLLARSLTSATILVSIGFAIEWHFSLSAGIWSWTDAFGGRWINGIPVNNFIVWFNIGMASPLIEEIARMPRITYRIKSLSCRALPTIGLMLVLIVNSALNFQRGLPSAGALTGSAFLILAAAFAFRLRQLKAARGPLD